MSNQQSTEIFSLLAKPLEPTTNFRLVSCKVVETCNALEVAKQIHEAMKSHSIAMENLKVFVSDNAPYIIMAGTKLQALSYKHTLYSYALHVLGTYFTPCI